MQHWFVLRLLRNGGSCLWLLLLLQSFGSLLPLLC
jgi:hypothetical protein